MIIIKNIIFDLGGVILKGEPISVLKNIKIDDKTYNNLKIYFDDWKDLNLGNESLEEKFNKCSFPKEIEKEYKNILLNYYKYREFNKDLINLINKLKDNNYNVYILSDNSKECLEYYKNHKIFKNIDGWVLSCEYNTCKCDGKLFDIIIKKFNLVPSESYFIDNSIDNIKESIKHGIKGYVFNEEEDINKLYNDMRDNDINI